MINGNIITDYLYTSVKILNKFQTFSGLNLYP